MFYKRSGGVGTGRYAGSPFVDNNRPSLKTLALTGTGLSLAGLGILFSLGVI